MNEALDILAHVLAFLIGFSTGWALCGIVEHYSRRGDGIAHQISAQAKSLHESMAAEDRLIEQRLVSIRAACGRIRANAAQLRADQAARTRTALEGFISGFEMVQVPETRTRGLDLIPFASVAGVEANRPDGEYVNKYGNKVVLTTLGDGIRHMKTFGPGGIENSLYREDPPEPQEEYGRRIRLDVDQPLSPEDVELLNTQAIDEHLSQTPQ